MIGLDFRWPFDLLDHIILLVILWRIAKSVQELIKDEPIQKETNSFPQKFKDQPKLGSDFQYIWLFHSLIKVALGINSLEQRLLSRLILTCPKGILSISKTRWNSIEHSFGSDKRISSKLGYRKSQPSDLLVPCHWCFKGWSPNTFGYSIQLTFPYSLPKFIFLKLTSFLSRIDQTSYLRNKWILNFFQKTFTQNFWDPFSFLFVKIFLPNNR